MFRFALKNGYLIVPLSSRLLAFLAQIAYRRTRVPIGEETSAHRHIFFSFYIAEKIRALRRANGAETNLPQRALVIVLPFVSHAWVNIEGTAADSYVHDLTPLHRPHVFA